MVSIMKFNLRVLALFMLAHVATAQNELEKITKLSSPADDQNPIVSPDGQRMYFLRQRHPQNVGGIKDPGDIWYAELQGDSSWSEAKNMKDLNTQHFNSIIGFGEGGELVFLNGHYMKGGNKPTSQGVSVARRQGLGWSKPEALKIPYFYNKSDHQSGSLHSGGQVMLLALQSYDTRGAEDLYVLFKKSDGSWSEPLNLGRDINTPYQEMTPFLAPDGKTLYFASNGYETFGSRDIFVSVRLDDSWEKWSNPKNLGAYVNSEGTELYYRIPAGSDYAYLSSTQNSDGRGDLNRVRISPEEEEMQEEPIVLQTEEETPLPPVEDANQDETVEEAEPEAQVAVEEPTDIRVRGQILNVKTQEPIVAEVLIVGLKKATEDTLRAQTREDGIFDLNLPPDNDYQIVVASEGYIREKNNVLLSQQAPIDNSDVVVRNFTLTPIEVGTTVNLENVLFDRGTAEMLSGSTETLDEVVLFLEENPEVEIEVSGHTDNRGRPDLNQILSQERAEAVKRYLVQQGVIASRITEKGYGGTRPIASNAIEEERRRNRRVEFTILKK